MNAFDMQWRIHDALKNGEFRPEVEKTYNLSLQRITRLVSTDGNAAQLGGALFFSRVYKGGENGFFTLVFGKLGDNDASRYELSFDTARKIFIAHEFLNFCDWLLRRMENAVTPINPIILKESDGYGVWS